MEGVNLTVDSLWTISGIKYFTMQGGSYENTETENIVAFLFNGEYRFRFTGGFFMNAGVFFGAARGTTEAVFTDPSYQNDGDIFVRPFGMAELTFGIEY